MYYVTNHIAGLLHFSIDGLQVGITNDVILLLEAQVDRYIAATVKDTLRCPEVTFT